MRHQYGGFYEFLTQATCTETGNKVSVYRHVWPFEEQWFTRPAHEFFDGRFRQSTQEELDSFKKKGKEQCQAQISVLKKLKKPYWEDNVIP